MVDGLPALLGRGEHDLEVLAQPRLTDELPEAAGAQRGLFRDLGSSASGLSSSSLMLPTGQEPQRLAQQLFDGAVLAQLAEHVAHLVVAVPEADERVAYLGARVRGPVPPPSVRSTSGSSSRAFRSTRSRCAVRLPTPGTATSESRSSSARQRRRLGGECTDRIASASFGPTPLAVISASNVSRSSRVGNPYSTSASSRTC